MDTGGPNQNPHVHSSKIEAEMTPAKAAQACIDRFAGKTYEPGKRDCAIMAAHLLHQYGVKVPHLKGVSYKTEAGAVRAMLRAGFANMVEAVDSLGLERIAPARAITGDLIGLPSDGGPWGCALSVAVGGGRVLTFVEGVAEICDPKAFVAAWRRP
jgi:hypothetical protein